jgi:hypothetical protein
MDPGSGSLLLQAILGGVAGLAVLAKLFWHRLARQSRRPSEAQANEVSEDR